MTSLPTILAGAPRRAALLLILAGSLLGCQDRRDKPAGPSSPTPPASRPVDPAALGTDRRGTLRALRMPMREVVRSLGGLRLTCRSRLTTQLPGEPPRELQQDISVEADGRGQFAAVKTTHPQYGHELIWTGGVLYPRLRWNKFVKRRASPEEPARLLDRLAGLLPAYVGLLRRFVTVTRLGAGTYLGRETVRVKLGLDPSPPPPRAERGPARLWRRTLSVTQLEGEVQLDRSGAPLRAELSARWSFNVPTSPVPRSGIPGEIDPKRVGKTELRFSLQVADLGRVAPIRPPPEAETIESPRLIRTEIERQILTGELPLEEGWGPP